MIALRLWCNSSIVSASVVDAKKKRRKKQHNLEQLLSQLSCRLITPQGEGGNDAGEDWEKETDGKTGTQGQTCG